MPGSVGLLGVDQRRTGDVLADHHQPRTTMRLVGRRDIGDDEPAYVFRSPCCGVDEVVPAWSVAAATIRARGRIRLQCGRTLTDPLRAVGTGARKGCGEPFEVDCSQLQQRGTEI